MAPDEPQLICGDVLEEGRERWEQREKCRDVVFLAEWREYLKESAWFDCLADLGLEGPLADPGEEHAGCVEATLEFYDSLDEVQLSEECVDAVDRLIDEHRDDYWDCIKKFNEEHPPG